jgi:hypothetical protein
MVYHPELLIRILEKARSRKRIGDRVGGARFRVEVLESEYRGQSGEAMQLLAAEAREMFSFLVCAGVSIK